MDERDWRMNKIEWAPLRRFAVSFADLGLGSVVLWLRLFPQLTAIWVTGWLLSELFTRITTSLPVEWIWLNLFVFALSFLSTLAAIVIMLRVIAYHLDLWDLVAEDEGNRSTTKVLAATLLPFLGIYAALNQVAARADELTALTTIQTGLLADHTIWTETNPLSSPTRLIMVVAIVVVVYIVRRALDLLHEKTEWRPFGLLATLLEAYFLIFVILSGTTLLRAGKSWWEERQLVAWGDDAGTALGSFLGQFHISLPAVLRVSWDFLSSTVWPLFLNGLAQPVVWLAVAALVFGAKSMSTAGLWGERGEQAADAHTKIPARLRRLHKARSGLAQNQRLRRAWLEFQEAFLSDIDDRLLPVIHSVRLVLNSGLSFLAAYVSVYALWTLLESLVATVLVRLIGGHEVTVWLVVQPAMSLVHGGILEPLRMCLLALAFHRCIAVFDGNSGANAAAHDSTSGVESGDPMVAVGSERSQ